MAGLPVCPQCGEPVQPHWTSCPACGYAPGDAAAAASTRADAAPPSPPAVPPSGGSAFAVDRRVVVVAVAVALVVVVVAVYLIMGTGETKKAELDTSGTTLPPVGAIAMNQQTTTASTTVPGRRDCDSKTSQHSPDGADYTPCDAGFAIDLPGRPDLDTRKEELPTGAVTFSLLNSSATSADRKQYTRIVVVWADLGREPSADEANTVIEAAMNQLGAKPSGSTSFQGHPAVAFSGYDGQWYQQGAAFVRGPMVYVVAVQGLAPITDEFADLTSRFRLV